MSPFALFQRVVSVALLSSCLSLPAAAGSLIDRVTLITDAADPKLTESLAQTLGNGFIVNNATANDPSAWKSADFAILALNSIPSQKLIDDLVNHPTIDRVLLSPPPKSIANPSKLELSLSSLARSPKVFVSHPSWLAIRTPEDICRLWASTLNQPADSSSPTPKWLEAWKNEKPSVAESPLSPEAITLANRSLTIHVPPHPRPGLFPIWVAADIQKPEILHALRPWIDLGFPILQIQFPATATTLDTQTAHLRSLYDFTTRAGFNRQGLIFAQANLCDPMVKWATDDPWRILSLSLIHPNLTQLDSLKTLANFNRWDRPGIAISLIDTNPQPEIQAILETSAGPSQVSPTLTPSTAWLHRHSHVMSATERFLSRDRLSSQYPHLDAKTTLEKFATSPWGDKPQKFRPSQNYFKGTPSGFDRTESAWRTTHQLTRTANGLAGPTICLSDADLKKATLPAVLLKDCINTLGELAWHWEEDCRNPDDAQRIQALILDLSEWVARSLESWNDQEIPVPGSQYDIKALNRLAGISAILPEPHAFWLGQLAFSDLKDRFKEEPYNDMDILRWTSQFPPSINFFKNPNTRYQYLLEIADYFDRVFHTNTGCGMEGTPQHHGLWHYSYASYSISSGYSILKNFHQIGVFFSKSTYDRFKKTAVNMALLARPDLYDSIAPIAYNARVGMECYLRWQPLADACLLGNGTAPYELDPSLLNLLAQIDPQHTLVKDAAKQGKLPPPTPIPTLTQINAGALVSRQYDRLQATVSGMSGPFGARSEIYMNWAGNYYSLYLKAGSLLLRSPKKDQAETFDHYHGFDHSFIPGATSLISTDRELFCRGVHTGVSTNGIGGGTSFANDASAVVATTTTVGPMPSCRKSYFFFGNRITSLTSNIQRWSPDMEKSTGRNSSFLTINDPTRPIVTTLYQWPDDPSITSESLTSKKLDHALVQSDRYGHAYIVHPNPNATLITRTGPQSYISLLKDKLKPGKENFETKGELRHVLQGKIKHDDLLDCYEPSTGVWQRSWIEHSLTDGSDQATAGFSLLVKPAPGEADALANSFNSDQAPFSILQQNRQAHILLDKASKTTACAFFEPSTLTNPSSLIKDVSSPCFLMFKPSTGKNMTFSFVNADTKANRAVRFTLNGRWQSPLKSNTLADGSTLKITHQNQTTTLTLLAPPPEDFLTFSTTATSQYYQTRHLLPIEFTLTPLP